MSVFVHETLLKEYYDKQSDIQPYLSELKQIVIDSKESLEGNAFYVHNSLNLYD
jgi:hypothetical protein